MNEAKRLRERFLADFKRYSDAHLSANAQDWTTYEHEAALLCTLLDTMRIDPYRDRILDAVSVYVLEARNGRRGAITHLLETLADLRVERNGVTP